MQVVRNPIYTGNILIVFGLALSVQAVYALWYVPVVAVLFAILCRIEERGLMEEYGAEYRDYRQHGHYRLIPYIF